MLKWIVGAAALLMAGAASAQSLPERWHAREGDYVARNYRFKDGETLAEARVHYLTLGEPRRDRAGHVTNAVMILHGTGGTGRQFLRPQFADVLFRAGGLLDPAKYFIILPDNFGHGKSSKPSDGLRMKFPKYDYDDMVALQHAMLTEGLRVDGLRLILGTSMGCMHAFVWGETYPSFTQALAPFACLPTKIVGRNRMWRSMSIQAIEADPAWKGGDYAAEPTEGLRSWAVINALVGSAPILMQKELATRDAADAAAKKAVTDSSTWPDANDAIYFLDASRNYDPSSALEKITAPVLWINSADDVINPPELGIAQKLAPRIKRGRFILIPASEETHGHGSHTWARLWEKDLARFLKATER